MFGLGDQGEPSNNKTTDVDANKTSDTFFPSVKAVYDWAVGLFARGATSSDANAIARFVGTNGKSLQNSAATIDDNGVATFNSTGDIGLRVIGSGSSAGTWRGRIVAGGDSVVFLMGEASSKAWLGAHNGTLTDWADIYVSPAGGKTLYLSHVGGSTILAGNTVLDGTFTDNVGSQGADGQVIKKVGGLVLWSNP